MPTPDKQSDARELNARTAVVTGSSSGIGRAIAVELARAGAAVMVHCRSNAAAAQETAAMIGGHGSEAQVLQADLTDAEARIDFFRRAWDWRWGVDIWVNNAGADVLTGEAGDESFEAKLDLLWRTDVETTIVLSRLVGLRMKHSRSQHRPVVLNMGWDQAAVGMGGDAGEIFAAIKGAVMAFTKSLAKSLAPAVRVNCLAPGWIKTAWGEEASDYWQQRAAEESLSARWGTPEDVARAARFLASPASDFVNGQIIEINGGLQRGAS